MSKFQVKATPVDENIKPKCPRCWHYTAEGRFNYDNLCDRCCLVMIECFPDHVATPHIIKSREKQKLMFGVDKTDLEKD